MRTQREITHLDLRGKPLCGADPAGAFVVDEFRHVTCSACRNEIEMRTMWTRMLKKPNEVN
jgi:hypothetical protein